MSQEAILEKVRDVMHELFDIERSKVTLESRFMEDLDLTSLDAIDLVVKLEEITGKKVDENQLRQVRSVGDIVKLVESMDLQKSA